MIFDVITIFPELFTSILEHGPIRRVLGSGGMEVRLHNLRDFADDHYRSVDDRPFGGGPGMVFKPEPLFRAVEAIEAGAPDARFRVILLSPQGSALNQKKAEEFSREDRVVLICGRYEGVDERVTQHLATDEISIGDYVLSGGELAAAVVLDAVARLMPGGIGNEESKSIESFTTLQEEALPDARGPAALLDFPQYTRPADFRGLKVPGVLLSGNHQQINEWRSRQALLKTCRMRPDLLEKAGLSPEQVRAEIEETSLKR
ncbi:MAG: tRNA (guanosine(37)-N1)-methyltransferase TrmD [Terriglobia bacterium]